MKSSFVRKSSTNRGVSLVISVLIMSLILTIVLAISATFVGEVKNSRIYENSTSAFYAADSGAEAILYNQRKNSSKQLAAPGDYSCSDIVPNMVLVNPALSCDAHITTSGSSTILQITGRYNTTEAQRKVEVIY